MWNDYRKLLTIGEKLHTIILSRAAYRLLSSKLHFILSAILLKAAIIYKYYRKPLRFKTSISRAIYNSRHRYHQELFFEHVVTTKNCERSRIIRSERVRPTTELPPSIGYFRQPRTRGVRSALVWLRPMAYDDVWLTTFQWVFFEAIFLTICIYIPTWSWLRTFGKNSLARFCTQREC